MLSNVIHKLEQQFVVGSGLIPSAQSHRLHETQFLALLCEICWDHGQFIHGKVLRISTMLPQLIADEWARRE